MDADNSGLTGVREGAALVIKVPSISIAGYSDIDVRMIVYGFKKRLRGTKKCQQSVWDLLNDRRYVSTSR